MDDIAKFGAVVAVFLMSFLLVVDYTQTGELPEAHAIESTQA